MLITSSWFRLINLAGDDQSENNNGENICRNQIDSLELNEKADEGKNVLGILQAESSFINMSWFVK